MKSNLVIHLSLPFFFLMHNLICGNQTCSKLEFVQGSDKIVAFEVNLIFYLDTKQCSTNQTHYTITLSRDDHGRHTDICKIVLADKCTVSRYSVGCSCLSNLGPMMFSKNVTSDDNNTVYVWKWGDIFPWENERRIQFEAASEPPRRGQSTEGAGAKVAHVKGTESQVDNSMVVVISMSTAACLVVIAAVVITAIACRRRVGRGFDEKRLRHGDHKALIVSYTQDTPLPAKPFGDQAADIYDEIGVAPKPHERCRVSLKTGVSLPPIPVSHLYVETPCSAPGSQREIQDKSVEYLHPLEVAGMHTEETAEHRVVSCAQSLAKWRPLSNSM